MLEYLRKFERMLVISLTVMMALVLFFATVELAYMLIKDIITPPIFILNIKQLLALFGLFLLVLIGIELLVKMKIYISEHVIRVQVVFMVALIAVARKVIVLDSRFPALH